MKNFILQSLKIRKKCIQLCVCVCINVICDFGGTTLDGFSGFFFFKLSCFAFLFMYVTQCTMLKLYMSCVYC